MIIKKIKLNNIRSYTDEEIELPEGSVLLSGDIGSGKSTILLSVDFALFGLRRGDLSGPSLLRNGKKKGFVELYFDIDDKEVVIKRTLARTNTSVVQDSGFIAINGHKKELTPTELKQTILELLNYPQDILTKSKDLIYRYTVYTPQEEMKQILLVENDVRLDTLRKVFGIDKYKKITENSNIFLRKLREKRREYAGAIADLETKKTDREIKKQAIKSLKDKIKDSEVTIKNIKAKLDEKQTTIDKIDSKAKQLNKLANTLCLKSLFLHQNA